MDSRTLGSWKVGCSRQALLVLAPVFIGIMAFLSGTP